MNAPLSRRSWSRPVLLALLLAGVLAAPGCRRKEAEPSWSETEKTIESIRKEKTEVDRKTDEILKSIAEYNRTRPPGTPELNFAEIFDPNLAPEQKDVLTTLLAEEKDASYKGLLDEIRARRDEIQGLQEKILALEDKLPDRFVTVEKGDSHYALALRYLTQDRGLSEPDARKAIADVNLLEDILPGNHVYLFYDVDTGRFGTYVTQGEAKAPPIAVQRAVRRKLISERDAARSMAAALGEKNAALEADKASLEVQLARLQTEIRDLEERKARLEADLITAMQEAERVAHSVFYAVASADKLKSEGIVRDTVFTFPQLENPDRVVYDQTLDLRKSKTLAFNPLDFNLEKIRHVVLFPKFYQEDRDYAVTLQPDGGAVVEILKPEVFENRRVLFALR